MKSFGEILKSLRMNRGVTQEKLANDLDIPESTIRRLEISKGVPRRERLEQIADYFNVTTDFLLGRNQKELDNETEIDRKRNELMSIINTINDLNELNYTAELIKKLTKK